MSNKEKQKLSELIIKLKNKYIQSCLAVGAPIEEPIKLCGKPLDEYTLAELIKPINELSLTYNLDEYQPGGEEVVCADSLLELPKQDGGFALKNLNEEAAQQTFDTGAKRDSQSGRFRPDLVHPIMLYRMGKILGKGAEHYGERNFEKGIPSSRCLASLERHLVKFRMGAKDEDHLAAVAINAMFIMLNELIHGEDINDLPVYDESFKE